MGIKLFIVRVFVLITLVGCYHSAIAQTRTLDRKKWKQLREEIEKRRYDGREPITDRDVERENRTYYDNEDANRWSKDDSRHQDPNRRSDYSNNDKSDEGDGLGGDGGNGDGTGDGSGGGDADIFDDNSGEGNEAEDELENSTWSDEGNGSGRESTSENTYNVDPPEKDRSSSSRSSSGGGGAGISTVFMWILLGVLIGVVLFLILRSVDWKNKKVKKQLIETADPFETLEFTKSELELAIEKALAEGNFREAVRIYFLAVVKELRDKGLIKWEKKKTNYAYLTEMTTHPQYNRFEFATRIFEVVWYGNRKINRDEFNSVEPLYKGLLKDIVRP